MKPLSTLSYIRMNLKKTIVVSASIGMAILFIYILGITIKTVDRSQVWIDLNPTKQYSVLIGQGDKEISEELVQQIAKHESTERVIGIKGLNTYYTHIMSGTMGFGVWFMNEADIQEVMEKQNLRLLEGRLPTPGAEELVLHELLLQNKGLQLGDKIGNSLDATEWIPGSYEIVGVLTGDSITGFGTLELDTNNVQLLKKIVMVLHKEGERETSNHFLKSVVPKEINLITYDRMSEMIAENNQALYSVLNIVLTVAIVVLSVAIGNSTYLHFFERKKEYALLRALGYSRGWILAKAGQEIAVTSLLGLTFGLLATCVALYFFVHFVLVKVGAPYELFDIRGMMNSVTIVLAATIACLIPVWMFLGKIDVIETIEGGE